ncbi:alkaline phosphatase family protein [Niabella hibiscisoli]|uniref:alkaline phosphatase family protein n=1 Tax=Niabella hibiscisoli TaxID=1825928 RepID=UPI001F0F146B|nr:alkaline phosphatase family protein [Niabella hibiscisoli]MCH5719361.1 alkaline phosphatase family protein [Niabella hibiscisoli]
MEKYFAILSVITNAWRITLLAFSTVLLLACDRSISGPGNPPSADSSGNNNGTTVKIKKVLFIGIDGCLWSTFSTANTPNIKALMDSGYASTNALAEVPTWSAVGWSGLLTGTSVARHKASDNSFSGSDFINNPSFFSQVKESLPGYRTGSVTTWAPINNTIINSADISFKLNPGTDVATEQAMINELSTQDPGVLFCHFDDVDHAGHATGFSASNTDYVNAVKATDIRVGHILEALKKRKSFALEDWLIVIASDHGGIGNSHGGNSYLERNSFIILHNKAIAPRLVNQTPVTTVQTSPSSVAALNFGPDVYGTLPALSSQTLALDANASFTIEFRVRAAANNSDPVIIGNKNWASGYNKGVIIANRAGSIRVNLGDGSNRVDLDGVNLSDGYWHHVSVVVNRTAQLMTLYDGGLEVASKSISQVGALQSGTGFRVGQDATENYGVYFSGNISGIRIFRYAVAAAAVNSYAFKDIDNAHPGLADLVFCTNGRDGAGARYAGSWGSGDLSILAKNSAAINWPVINSPVFKTAAIDYQGAPYLYDVAPTILKFLGVQRPANYSGNSIINF